MKTLRSVIVFTFFLVMSLAVFAQSESDALRLSQYYVGGTARGVSMGGAFGALGGDMTSLSINPAGIGVYRSSEFTFTPTIIGDNSKSTYYGNSYTDIKNSFNLNNIGYVYTLNTQREQGWVSLSFGIGYNRLADFNRNVTIATNNAQSTMLDEFVGIANMAEGSTKEEKVNNLDQNYELLAVKTYAIEYDPQAKEFYNDDFNTSNVDRYQEHMVNTKGGIGEYTFSMGGNYSNCLYLGATLGIQSVYYEEVKDHFEDYGNNGVNLRNFDFTDNFNVSGTGVNFKGGAIYKPVDLLRLGLAFQSPTYYSLRSKFYTTMNTLFHDGENYSKESDITTYDYNVSTPMKVVASAAVKLQQIALLSMDYEFVDYSMIHMRADDNSFTDINSNIQNDYKSTYNLKTGVEIKLGDFALRGGYGFYGSPYKNNSDRTTTSYSGGLGYRGPNFFIDFAYLMLQTKYDHTLYTTYNNINETAQITSNNSRYMMTIGFKF